MHQPPIPHVARTDPEIASLIEHEARREFEKIRLIPSENYVSVAVLEASGSVLTNKYSEGYPGRRYYEGQQFVDVIETMAVQRAQALFGVEHANVQPYSGSPANLAVYLAFAQPGDTIMGMSLPMGGHLTHGWPVSVTGKWFRSVQYGVRADTGRLDLDEVRDLARRERPKLIFCGGTAIPRTIDFPAFAEIAAEVGAVLVADIAHIAGLIAGGAHPSPAGHAGVITTTTHKTLRGPRGGAILCREEFAKKIDSAVFPGQQGGPLEHSIAAKAVAFREAALPSFSTYTNQIVANAKAFGAALAGEGFRLVSGGTENHMLLVDLREFDAELTGKVAQEVLDRAGITTNRNTIPDDPRSAFITSGLRLGTPAETTAGMKQGEFVTVAQLMARALRGREDEAVLAQVRGEVATLCGAFNPYAGFTK